MTRYNIFRIMFAVVAGLIAMTSIQGCRKRQPDNDIADIKSLVAETISLTNKYYDSISMARDSFEVKRLMTNFDDALTKINYKHKPDLYLQMHDGDNDTISRAILRVVAKKDSVLFNKGRRSIVVNGDTISLDSVPPIPYRRN